jgi:transposase
MPNRNNGAMHVATTKRTYRGKVYVTHLLRRSFREGEKVKHQTLGNLSHLPPDLIDTIRRRLAGEEPSEGGGWEIVRSLPHGHVAAVLGTLRQLGVEGLLAWRPSRERSLATALIVMRLIAPQSKLATCRGLKEQTATNSLALELGLGEIAEEEIYRTLDWLGLRQRRIESKLSQRHLQDGTLVLYDVSSSYYTGRRTGLVQFGYNRDGRKDCPQIVYGLLCNAAGCPVAIEVFAGNTADPKTLGPQIEKLRRRFGVQRVVLVGDRGMITSKRIDESLRDVEGLDWITALRADSIQKLASQGLIQPSLFDQRDLVEIVSPDYPGERLVVCRNPLLADERARKRQELLAATEKKLAEIVAATRRPRRPLRSKAQIGLRVGKVLNHYKVGKHFQLEIEDQNFAFRRDEARIAAEAALDGLYVIRTSVEEEAFSSENTVRAYKDLAKVERAFRSMKTIDLHVRPIFHWLDERIQAHVFLCMLSYYVEWHMRQRLAAVLFDDHDRESAEALRQSIVAPAPRSDAARRKDQTKHTASGEPVHSFRSLLADLGTLCKNRVRLRSNPSVEFYLLTRSTPPQEKAFSLLGLEIPR